MAFIQLSPGVSIKETDLSQIIAQVATSSAVAVGFARKGRSFQRVPVTADKEYVEKFGKPDPNDGFLGYSALAYLAEGSDLTVTRVHNGAKFAGAIVADDVDIHLSPWGELIGQQDSQSLQSSFATTLEKSPVVPASLQVYAKVPSLAGPEAAGTTVALNAGPYALAAALNLPVLKRTVQVYAQYTAGGAIEVFTDDTGSGVLTGTNGGSGLFDYVTGVGNITFGAAPDGAYPISLRYQYASTLTARSDAYGLFQSTLSNPKFSGSVNHASGDINVTFNSVPVSAEDTGVDSDLISLTFLSTLPIYRLKRTPIIPLSVSIKVPIAAGPVYETFSDANTGDGTLIRSSDNTVAGTINYRTGEWSVTLAALSTLVGNITADYDYQEKPAADSQLNVYYSYVPKFQSVVNFDVFLGIGNGVTTSFAAVLRGPLKATTDPLSPTFKLYQAGSLVGRSIVNGDIISDASVLAAPSPTVNHLNWSTTNPAINIVFTTPPANGQAVFARYSLEGIEDLDTVDFPDYLDPILALFADNEGDWANSDTSPEGLRFRVDNINEIDGTFDVTVYQKQNGTFVSISKFIVSRKQITDGNGRQLYIEKRLNDMNNYVRAKNNVAVSDTVLPYHTVSAEALIDGDGATNDFTAQTAQTPVQEGSISITAYVNGAYETLTDAGGRLVDSGGALHGTVNYETGAIEDISFSQAPDAPTAIVSEAHGDTGLAPTVGPYSGTLVNFPMKPGTVSFSIAPTTLVDDGAGNLRETNLLGAKRGTINYATGDYTFTLGAVPAPSVAIMADYIYNHISINYFTGIDVEIDGGDDGLAITSADLIAGWDLYSNPEEVDFRISINSGYTAIPVQQKLVQIATNRMDNIAVLDVTPDAFDPNLSPTESAQQAVVWRKKIQNFNTSYSALYAPYLRVYDRYSDREVQCPPSGYATGVYARNDRLAEAWTAPAGFKRGKLDILGVTHEYGQSQRDLLYSNGINPIRNFPGEGIVIWGQKTEQASASALDRVNVRRLLIVLEKSVSTFLNNSTFELNDEFTRLAIFNGVDSYMRQVQARRGVYEYQVVCDESNNTADIIDQNQLLCDVYIKPAKAAEFIRLQMVITTTGASFQELIAQGGQFG